MTLPPTFGHLLLNALIGVLVLGGGFLLGWWLRRILLLPSSRQNDERAREAASQMSSVARRVSSQMDRHRREMAETLRRISGETQGDQEAISQGLKQLMESNEQLQVLLADAEKKLHQQAQTIVDYAARARTDTLTQVLNRGAFDEELQRRMAQWQRRGHSFCVLMLDVDQFKEINDEHGHQAGDEVLQHVAQVLRGTMREMDLVARFGGDEFAMLLPDTDLAEAALAADRLRRRIEGLRVPVDDVSLSLTISVGVAEVQPTDDAEVVVRRADEALYAAKNAGRNCAYFHDGNGMNRLEAPGATSETPLAEQAVYDTLLEDISCRLAECERTGQFLSLLVVDLEGDARLLERPDLRTSVAEALQTALREMDKCVLIGACQFAAILPLANDEQARMIASRAEGAVGQILDGCPQHGDIVVRTGTATNQSGDSAVSLLSRAIPAGIAPLVMHPSKR